MSLSFLIFCSCRLQLNSLSLHVRLNGSAILSVKALPVALPVFQKLVKLKLLKLNFKKVLHSQS